MEYLNPDEVLMADEAQFKGDDELRVRFFRHARLNVQKTKGWREMLTDGTYVEHPPAGRPIYDELDYISIEKRNDKLNIPMRPVSPHDKFRFAKLWKQYEASRENPATGTPIEEWTAMSKSVAAELRGVGIRTVEQLADTTEDQLSRFGQNASWASMADAWLKRAKRDAPSMKAAADLEQSKQEIADLKSQMAELLAAVRAKDAADSTEDAAPEAAEPVKRGPGRPKKEQIHGEV